MIAPFLVAPFLIAPELCQISPRYSKNHYTAYFTTGLAWYYRSPVTASLVNASLAKHEPFYNGASNKQRKTINQI